MNISLLSGNFVVCRLDAEDCIPTWIATKSFYSITRTNEELSIVCLDKNVPSEIKCEKGWRILKIEGPLDFSLIGILSKISTLLANEKISIFAVSTYDTDYILIKEESIENSIRILEDNDIIINR